MAASKERLAGRHEPSLHRPAQVSRRSVPSRVRSPAANPPLARTLDAAVIPRLVLAGRVDRARRESGTESRDLRVETLAELVLQKDAAAAQGYVDSLHDGGSSFEQLYLDVVTPAARRLGEFWTEDRCHFTEVTLAVSRLHQLLHLLGHVFYAEDPHAELRRRALLLPMPGEQHSFGLAMVAEFFRRAGWDVWSGGATTRLELLQLVGRERFDLVGLSVGADRGIDHLPSLVHAIRSRSRRQATAVFVGGPAFVARPELAKEVGADATALDGRQAVDQAERLLAMRGSVQR